jgi:acid phosphatase (class A)
MKARLVCNAHWQSDVLAGRTVAAATVARLHADATFRSDVAMAREEARRAVPVDAAKCSSEAPLTAPVAGAL